jgi:hypothetical protein
MGYSKSAQQLIKNKKGYRNDNLYSSYMLCYKALDVLDYEYHELHNTDIMVTLVNHGLIDTPDYDLAKQFIQEAEVAAGKPMYAFWLCATIKDIDAYYYDVFDDADDKSEDEDDADGEQYADTVMVYRLPEVYVILSDLGSQGILIMSDSTLKDCFIKEINR